MWVQPWDASLDEAEWQTWIAEGHDFGQLSVNGLPGHPPINIPTHFTCDGHHLLVHLARPNPVFNVPAARQQLRRLDRIGPCKP